MFRAVLLCSLSFAAALKLRQNAELDRFEVAYEWSYVNFTWPSPEVYALAVQYEDYVPENNVVSCVRFYGGRMYLALMRTRIGTPVTLAYVPVMEGRSVNPLLTPYPSWGMNVGESCSTLQNVHSFEIDSKGVMWVIDGVRFNPLTDCPCKLMLLDLRRGGRVLQSYTFSTEVAPPGNHLNQIVVDETDGGFAYISDSSPVDPGVVVYSRHLDRAWKLRDKSMRGAPAAQPVVVEGVAVQQLVGIVGLALSPVSRHKTAGKHLFYSPLISHQIYAVNTEAIKHSSKKNRYLWSRDIKHVGSKGDAGDGMIADNVGNVYFGLVQSYAVGVWNMYRRFKTAAIIYTDPETMVWPHSFAIDGTGFLYVLANELNLFIQNTTLVLSDRIRMRIFRDYIGHRSYLSGKH